MTATHNNKQYHNVTDLTRFPIYTGTELEYFAAKYHAIARLKQRMTFGEFMAAPDAYLATVDQWPDAIWCVDFIEQVGIKMWVVCTFTHKVLTVVDLPTKRSAAIIPAALRGVIEIHGKPDQIIVDHSSCFNTAAVNAFCRVEGITVKRPPQKPCCSQAAREVA